MSACATATVAVNWAAWTSLAVAAINGAARSHRVDSPVADAKESDDIFRGGSYTANDECNRIAPSGGSTPYCHDPPAVDEKDGKLVC